MVFDPGNVQALATGSAFFFMGATGLFLLFSKRNDHVARSFATALFFIAFWGLFGFLFHITKNADLAVRFRAVSVAFIALLTAGLNSFAAVFYQNARHDYVPWHRTGARISYGIAIVLALFSLSDAILRTQFIIRGIAPGAHEPLPGVLLPAIMVYFLVGTLYTGHLMYLSRQNSAPAYRAQANIILGSVFVGLLLGGTRFATWYGIPSVSALVGFAPFIFIVGVFYAIFRHQLFNLKVVGTEILVFTIWVALFVRVLLATNLRDQLIEGGLFVVIVVLGVFLVQSVLKEVKQRESLEEATKKLGTLNGRLEQMVRERTRELDTAKAHTEIIIENLTVGLVEFGHDFTVARVNRAAEQLLGVARDDVIGEKVTTKDMQVRERSSLARISYPGLSNAKTVSHEITAHIEHTPTTVQELTISYPKQRELEVTTAPIIDSHTGESLGFIKLLRDITIENAIDRNKSTFISVAAHQLRTPLSALRWTFELLSGDTKNLTDDQKALINDGQQANINMINVVNELLDVSHIESDDEALTLTDGNLVDVVEKACAGFQAVAKEKGVSLSCDVPAKLMVPMDEKRMSLVVTHILENAITYTPGGGSAKVTVRTQGGNAQVLVADTGVGIPEGDIEQIFTGFFRSKKAVHMETDKSGLGLYFVKKIVQKHHGDISVESKEGKGTTVTVTVPLSHTKS